MAKALKDIKVGDRVWVGDIDKNGGGELREVKRLTPTQIVVTDWSGKGVDRFQRGKPSTYPHVDPSPTYYQIGYHGWHLKAITGIATKAECDKWDRDQAVKQQQADVARQERERLEVKREELNALFSGHVYVRESHNNTAGDWQVDVWTDETGVRRLAEFLNAAERDADTR